MKNNSEQYKKELIEVLHKIGSDKQLLADFMRDILTPREFENISTRWEIVRRLAKGEYQQTIAEDLHLGIATVTRGSREMRKKEGGLRRALKVMKK